MKSRLSQIPGAKTLPFILLALAALSLASCGASIAGVSMVNGTTIGLGGAAAGAYATKPADLPPADLADQIPQHESWCYETMGYPECFAHPQKDANNRLINVDPESRYPLTARAYYEDVVEDQ